jgi:hypothetical protein
MFTYNTLGRIKGDATLSLIDSRPLFFVAARSKTCGYCPWPSEVGEFSAYRTLQPVFKVSADVSHDLIWHELGHFIQWRRLGNAACYNLPRFYGNNVPEQFVFDLLHRPGRWLRLSSLFKKASLRYIREVGGIVR